MKQNKKLGMLNTYDIFDGNALCPKHMFVELFREYPQVKEIYGLDTNKALGVMRKTFPARIKNEYAYSHFKASKKKFEAYEIILVMDDSILMHFDDSRVIVYHKGKAEKEVGILIPMISKCRKRAKKEPFEIRIIGRTKSGFDLKSMELKRMKLDIGLYYEDEFLEVDKAIQLRLNKSNDKGVVLLHGLPGTGKTSYLRYLIGKMKKPVIFLPSDSAYNLSSPEFTELLLRNTNSVLVIEDAENVIADRALDSRNSVAALLNLSDGLMSDFLNIQIICTFNKPLTMVDDALLRKGRLIARYEFDKLGINKAQRLSDHLGFNRVINEPMTLAEIANPGETTESVKPTVKIGFRSTILEK